MGDDDASLFVRIEEAEQRATRDFLNGDYCPPRACLPEPASPAVRPIRSGAKLATWHLINTENRTVSERKLFGLVDAVVALLDHGGREEQARLSLETVVRPSVALAALRLLTEDR